MPEHFWHTMIEDGSHRPEIEQHAEMVTCGVVIKYNITSGVRQGCGVVVFDCARVGVVTSVEDVVAAEIGHSHVPAGHRVGVDPRVSVPSAVRAKSVNKATFDRGAHGFGIFPIIEVTQQCYQGPAVCNTRGIHRLVYLASPQITLAKRVCVDVDECVQIVCHAVLEM